MVTRLRRYWAPALLIAGLVLAGIAVVGLRLAPGRQQAFPPPARIIAGTPPTVAPAPPDAAVRVVVDELNIDLPVVPGDGYNTPLYKAAEYPALRWPGQGGRSMLYAHARAGMFGPLFHAAVGQHVEVTLSSGRVLRYVIREYYPRWSSTDLKWLQPSSSEELILETCTTYNDNDPRIIAVAEPA